MKLWIENRQKKQKIDLRTVRKIAREILSVLGYPDAELSLSLVDDLQIAHLNQQYLNRARPTDVLAFPMREGACTEVNPNLLGDVVISVDTALRQAASRGHLFNDEFSFLLIHGILHLVGYDHENPGLETRRMRRKEKTLFLHLRAKFLELSE